MPGANRFIVLYLVAAIAACEPSVPNVDSTMISNAVVYDGSGNEPFPAAVRIGGDKIIAIGDLKALPGERVINADGFALAPGFIDSHSHHDEHLHTYRHMPGVLSQGVTTIVRGMDGFADNSNRLSSMTLVDFVAALESAPTAVNIASFAPHNSIRLAAMGSDHKRNATKDEITEMSALVAADMEAGALGLATGLEYVPGIYSSTEEVIALATTAASFDGRYASHIRDEDDQQADAIDEILTIGEQAQLPVHISHMKIADRAEWGSASKLIETLETARSSGIDVTADIYPYQRWASDLTILFPDRDFTNRSTAEFTFERTALPEDIVLSDYPPDPEIAGLSIAEISMLHEKDPVSMLLELTEIADDYFEETGRVGSGIIVKGMDENDVAHLMQWAFTNICSDGSHGGGHPRGYGAFPRVLGRFTRELDVLTLSEAVRKMTTLPAETLGISDRGRIDVGQYADLVLFDPKLITDKATMHDSTALSVGVQAVWVNGILAFDNGAPTMRYPGRIVRRALH